MSDTTTLRMERTYQASVDFGVADAATTVRFTHSGLWDEAAERSHEGGWGRAFDNLERTLAQDG